jgi:hypothetical protein
MKKVFFVVIELDDRDRYDRYQTHAQPMEATGGKKRKNERQAWTG